MSKRNRDPLGVGTLPETAPDEQNGRPAETDEEREARIAARKAEKGPKFKQLANKRVPRALKALDSVANLSNKSVYDYTDEQRDSIVAILRSRLKSLEERFNGDTKRDTEWSL